MAYTPYSLDPSQVEKAIQAYRNSKMQEMLKAEAAAEAKMEGVEQTVEAVLDMFHCSNYEENVMHTAAYRKGWVDAIRIIGAAFIPTIVLEDVLDGIELPQYDTDMRYDRAKELSMPFLKEKADMLAAKVKKLLESRANSEERTETNV